MARPSRLFVACAGLAVSALAPMASFAAEDGLPLHVAYRIYAGYKLVAAPELDIRPGVTANVEISSKLKLRVAVSAPRVPDRYQVATTLSVRSRRSWVDLPGWESESNGTAGVTVTRTAPDGTLYRVETSLGGGFLGPVKDRP